MTRYQRDAARTAGARLLIVVGSLLAVALCAVGGCVAELGPETVEARVVVDQGPGAACPGAPLKAHLRVMPVGDSTTAGNLAGSSWRAPLLAMLNERPDLQTVEFVGSQSAVAPCCYDGFPGASTAVAASRLPGDLAAFRPDVLLVLLGTNDQRPEAVPGYMRDVVDVALASSPDLLVLAAPVIYWAPDEGRRLAFNAALVSALRAHPAYGTRLLVVDAMADVVKPGSDFDQTTGQNDGVHPGPVGNEKMAAVWRAAGAGVAWLGGAL